MIELGKGNDRPKVSSLIIWVMMGDDRHATVDLCCRKPSVWMLQDSCIRLCRLVTFLLPETR